MEVTMTIRITLSAIVMLAVPVASVLAQMSGSASGRYSTYTVSQDLQEMEDGSGVILTHYHQKTFADDKGHPMDDMSSMCVGTLKVNTEGRVDSGYGSCFQETSDGDGVGMWWRMTHGGTADCPDICGEWGYYAGDGKFAGIEGGGTWQRTTLFADGSSGSWEGSYSMP
jgi:hypothetical protein